ncbi:hypothetical protein LZ31DRAFT_613710 [Colletotrichum somersetense]|nr:hypothetical protein LZ31DRAFT_613710 [Colletotrichum somersetense]
MVNGKWSANGATLVDTFVPFSTYNTLPLISQVAEAPTDHLQDLQDLRELLNKHNVPKGVSVRLIHNHFDTTEGEVIIFDKIPVQRHGAVQIMRPIRKFGLNLQREDDTDQSGWTECELHSKRGTIMFPDGMRMPDGESDYSVTTEGKAIFNELPKTCKHPSTCRHGRTTCKHCKHCNSHPDESNANSGNETGFCLGGQKILPGTPVHNIVGRIIAAF